MPNTLWTRDGLVTLTLLCLCVSAFLLAPMLDGMGLVSQGRLFGWLALSAGGIAQHRFWQLLTHAFLHANVRHLAFNMLGLAMLGPTIEGRLGRTRYLILSAVCALTAAIGSLIFRFPAQTAMCGYSGVLFGLLVAQARYFPDRILHVFGVFPMAMRHAVFVLGAIELYLTVLPDNGRVAQPAHLFGALGGWGCLVLMDRLAAWRPAPRTPVGHGGGRPGTIDRVPGIPNRL